MAFPAAALALFQLLNFLKKMKKTLILLLLFPFLFGPALAQQKLWSEADRQYQLENFRRTREALVKETADLSQAQWHFRESPDRWSIAEVVEHLALWEVIFARETSIALRSNPTPELNQTSRPDSYYLDFVLEEKSHSSPDYSRPTGFIQGKNNLTYFLNLRDQTINFISSTPSDLKAHFEPTGGGQFRNVHQIYIVQWGHVDRHLRQIRKVKAHPNYPKNLKS